MSELTDLEITGLCAKAMGIRTDGVTPNGTGHSFWARPNGNLQHYVYNPLDDDEQCFALVKRFNMKLTKKPFFKTWRAVCYHESGPLRGDVRAIADHDTDLNRAVCLCVATMELAKANV